MARANLTLAERLGEPGWLVSLAFAAVATALICYPIWPGLMSYDSLFAYEQARFGVQTMLWPPLHTYMFQLSEALGAGTWGVLVFQVFSLFAAVAVSLHLLVRSRWLAAVLCLVFAGLVAIFPTVLGTLFNQWRDVPTASFAFLGLALWLLAGRYAQPLLLIPAVAAFVCSIALRYNAFALVAFPLALLIWTPLLGRPSRVGRPLAALSVVAGLALAWASTQWRLPDLERLPPPANFRATQEFDLIGISACADRNYLPPALTDGRDMSPYFIRRNYNPRHLLLSLGPKAGVPAILQSDGDGAVQRAWPKVILREPGCYVAHRLAVFVEQMGLSDQGVFYPTHEGIDANAFGLKVAHPEAARMAVQHVAAWSGDLWRRPAWLYVLAPLLAGAALLRQRAYALLFLSLLAGAFAYPALLFLVSPAADARYIFPSNIACLFLAAASLGVLLDPRRAR
jgi:hypothetical protein